MRVSGPPWRQWRYYDPNDPADLKYLTETGLIWLTAYAQQGLDAVRTGAVRLSDCKDVPTNIAAILGRSRA